MVILFLPFLVFIFILLLPFFVLFAILFCIFLVFLLLPPGVVDDDAEVDAEVDDDAVVVTGGGAFNAANITLGFIISRVFNGIGNIS